jgi:UDP-N-acetylmuramyl pentapeptide phosphotransferase/UDP-N-acetylglucosamine-1-phosphate transferase
MMKDIVTLILISAFFAFAIAPLIINLLYKLNVVRKIENDFSSIVGERSIKAGTPIMGGLIVIITVFIITIAINWNAYTYVPILILLISAFFGALDDLLNIFGRKRLVRPLHKHLKLAMIHKDWRKRVWLLILTPWSAYKNLWYALGSYPGKGIHAGEKIIIQTITGGIVAFWIFTYLGISSIWIPFFGPLELGYFMPIFIIFTIISMSNAVNISDGMDGLSAGLLIPAFGAFLAIALLESHTEVSLLIATVIGALIAYLYFNIKPARIQFGDTGSLALGALLATVAFVQDKIILLLIIGLPFVLEIGSSLVQSIYRKIFRKRLLKMAPLHLHFLIKGWSEEKIVMRFWIFGLVSAIIGFWIYILSV